MLVLAWKAEPSAFKAETVSDLMRIADALDCFDSYNQCSHGEYKMDKSGLNLNVSHSDIGSLTNQTDGAATV